MAGLDIERLNRLLRRQKVSKLANGRYVIAPLILLPASEAADLMGEPLERIHRMLSGGEMLTYWPQGRDAEPHLNLFAIFGLLWGETRGVPAEWMDPEPEPTPIVRALPTRQSRPSLSRQLRFTILQRDGFACRYCGRKGDDARLQVDHVIPRAAGGTDDEGNLVTACYDCNQGKRVTLGVEAPPLQDAG
jgi:hypothetical protein